MREVVLLMGGRFDLAALVQPQLKFLFVCLFNAASSVLSIAAAGAAAACVHVDTCFNKGQFVVVLVMLLTVWECILGFMGVKASANAFRLMLVMQVLCLFVFLLFFLQCHLHL